MLIREENIRLAGAPLCKVRSAEPGRRGGGHVSRGRAPSSPTRVQAVGTGASLLRGSISVSKAGTCVKPAQDYRACLPKPASPRDEVLGILLNLSHVHIGSTLDLLTHASSPSLPRLPPLQSGNQGRKERSPYLGPGVVLEALSSFLYLTSPWPFGAGSSVFCCR